MGVDTVLAMGQDRPLYNSKIIDNGGSKNSVAQRSNAGA